MKKIILTAAFMALGHSVTMASGLFDRVKQGVASVGGKLANQVVINIKNDTDYAIFVSSSDAAEGLLQRLDTLAAKALTDSDLELGPRQRSEIILDKGREIPREGLITVAARYVNQKIPLVTYCKISPQTTSHTLVFEASGIGGRLYCNDKTK